MTVKILLKTIRNSRGVSQNQLARLTGMSVQNIQKIEYGHTKGLQYDTLNKLCQALDCQPGDLLQWIPDVETDSEKVVLLQKPSRLSSINLLP